MLKQKYIKKLLLFFIIVCYQLSIGQNNDYIKLEEPTQFTKDSCLTNKSDFKLLKLLVNDSITTLSRLNIEIKSQNNIKAFNTIESFNVFDFKFWLLSNNSFKSNTQLKLKLGYNVNGNIINQNFTFCLQFIEPNAIDRGTINNPDFVKLPIFFGTDRNYTKSNDLNKTFGVKRSKLKYGIVEVSIPHDHRVGEIETPSIWKFEFSEDPSKHIMLQKVSLFERQQFFKKLTQEIKSSDKKSTFLFVHGYNTSFSEAAKRTAQISYDLKFNGKAVFYSWPSQGSTLRYGKDEENIKWSQKNIKRFLEDYLSISEAENIYLVAHSMGNRGLTRALVDIVKEKPELSKKIKEIILAAPDIDADVFKNDIAPQMITNTKKPITLYVSSDDLALKASKLLHGNPRAGDAGEKMILIDGIETIDATGVDTSFLSHSYFADTNSIISDIFDIIQSGRRALERNSLQIVSFNKNIYWKVKH